MWAPDDVRAVYKEFLPLNTQSTQIFTAWQLEHLAVTPLRRLGDIARALDSLERRLAARLARFGGYHHRFASARTRATDDPVWLTGTRVDSCHRIWFELHEDLIATLGIFR